jgi:hypothetical protein
VPDLTAADLERELTTLPRPRLDALPRGDLLGDLIAGSALLVYQCLLSRTVLDQSTYNFNLT